MLQYQLLLKVGIYLVAVLLNVTFIASGNKILNVSTIMLNVTISCRVKWPWNHCNTEREVFLYTAMPIIMDNKCQQVKVFR